MHKEQPIRITLKDRKLGDEWAEWNGSLCENDINVEAGKRLYIGFALLSIILISVAAFIFWYLVSPRFYILSTQLAEVMRYTIIGAVILLFIWLLMNVLSIIFDKNLLLRIWGIEFSLCFFVPVVMRISKRFGVNKDKMGHSFVKVSNSLIHATKKNFDQVKILILLPHCLQRSILNAIKELANQYHISAFVASGGSIARKIIQEQNPTAVIGIACERDLVSGIQDIVPKIPVIGIPNRRPEGPCKNTTVDFREVEEAIRFFLGYHSAKITAR
ncbi:DUF116 domain-containing protein [candidate division KSB1 bacterium]|nr:DUF116 domain-containing protein [candidate division KSB1 bacterium]